MTEAQGKKGENGIVPVKRVAGKRGGGGTAAALLWNHSVPMAVRGG